MHFNASVQVDREKPTVRRALTVATRIPKLGGPVPFQSARLRVVSQNLRRNRTEREITPLWGEKKVVLRRTPRAVTRFGGLSLFIEFLGKIGVAKRVSKHLQQLNPNVRSRTLRKSGHS